MNKYRGQYIGEGKLKWITGEAHDVLIEENICTASINGKYVIWGSLEKLIGINENGEEMWIKY